MGLEGGAKGEVAERPEDRKGPGPDVGGRVDHDWGVELRSCTERNWRCDKAARKGDRNRLTGNGRVGDGWAVHGLGGKGVNE